MTREELIEMSNLDFTMSQEQFNKILEFLEVVKDVNVDGVKPFERSWLRLQMELDEPNDNHETEHGFEQNETGFFVTESSVKVRS